MHSTNSSESWHVRAVAVRDYNGSLRWDVEANRDGATTLVVADSTNHGSLIDLQSEDTITAELDHAVRTHVADVLALRSVLHSLPRVETTRHRSDRLRVA
jgi:hypothetical protein